MPLQRILTDRRTSSRIRSRFVPALLRLEGRALLYAPPVAYDVSFTVTHDQNLFDQVNGEIVDADVPGPLTYQLVAAPYGGSLSFDPTYGTFEYTPNYHFVGPDRFTFTVSDGENTSNVATATIIVTNALPEAADGTFTTTHDTPLNGELAGSDADDDIKYFVQSSTSHGNIYMTGYNNTFLYTPNPGYVGQDSFTYDTSDGIASSSDATVTINVTNAAPTATDSSIATLHDQPVGGNVSASDANGDPLTYTVGQEPSNGTLSFNSNDGTFTYTPNAGFTGRDFFVWYATDSTGATSNIASEYIDVTNVEPAANNNLFLLAHDTSVSGMATAVDPDGDALKYTVVGGVSHGSLSFDEAGNFTYTPTPGWYGTDSFQFKANDGVADSNAATITLNVSRWPATFTSSDAVGWSYTPNNQQWVAGANSVSISLSGTTMDGVSFEGPPTVTPNITDRFANSHTIIRDGDPVSFTRNVSGVLVQGYQATIDVKWSYSRDFFDVVPDWLETVFQNAATVTMETSITVTIMADGSTVAPVVTNSTNAPSSFSAQEQD